MTHDQLWISMRNYLDDPDLQGDIRHHLEKAQQQLTVSIEEAKQVIGNISAVQLRYWDEQGLFEKPKKDAQKKISPPRRYSSYDLARAMMIEKLLHLKPHPSIKEIKAFLEAEQPFVDNAIRSITTLGRQRTKQSHTIFQRIREAEDALFWRIFVPRIMYVSLCLLFEQSVSGDAGLVLSVGDKTLPAQEMTVKQPEDLAKLGEIIVGWQSKQRPFCMFLAEGSILDAVKDYEVRTIAQLLKEGDTCPKAAYLVSEKNLNSRLDTTHSRARQVAGRLLQLLLDTRNDWKPYMRSWEDFMLYHSSDFKDTTLGDRLLNGIAQRIVQLGGNQSQWKFCCILLPSDPSLPLKERKLVVQSQSLNSPYVPNETILLPHRQASMSTRAYQAGYIIYHPTIADKQAGVANLEVEGDIHSAIAVPIEAGYTENNNEQSEPLGVIYVVSEKADDFKEDSQVLLRVMGRIIAEQLVTSHARNILVDKLFEVVRHPRLVDSSFKEFLLESEFTSKLEELLNQIVASENNQIDSFQENAQSAIQTQPLDNLVCIGIDIDRSKELVRAYGNWIIKPIAQLIGRRIRQWAMQTYSGPDEFHLYYMYPDQFSLLLTNVPAKDIQLHAERLKETLHLSDYRIEMPSHVCIMPPDPANGRVTSREVVVSISFTIAVIESSLTRLRRILEQPENVQKVKRVPNARAWLIQTLDGALRLGKEGGGDQIVFWREQQEKFELLGKGERIQESGDGLLSNKDREH